MLSSACASSNEVIRVGVPFADGMTEGVHYKKEITDASSISTLRAILHNQQEVETLETLRLEPQAFFTIDHEDEEVSNVERYVWFSSNGRAVLSNERGVISTEDHQEFYRLTAEQTDELKSILN